MKPYSMDLRERVRQAFEQGQESLSAIAERFDLSLSCIRDWKRRYRETGSVAPLPPHPGRVRTIDTQGEEQLRSIVSERNDRTLEEIQHEYVKRHGLKLSKSTFCRALQRMKLTVKKKRFMPPNATDPRSNKRETNGRSKSLA